jgi:PII-like signaling protein
MKHEKLEGHAKLLRIFIDEADYWEGDLLYEAIVKKMHMMDIAGATVFRGLMGYGAQQRMHHIGWLGRPTELPIVVSIVDTEEKIRKVLPVLDEMVDEGLIVLSDVEVIKYTHSRSKQRGSEGKG